MVRLAPTITTTSPTGPADDVTVDALTRAAPLGVGDSLPSTSAALMGMGAEDLPRDDEEAFSARLSRLRGHTFADRLARAAERFVGGQTPSGFRRDCSGFVCASADRAGLGLEGGSEDLWATAVKVGTVHHRKQPDRGDLVFFDRTWDKDGNGRYDDELTHVGVVLDVDDEGTIRIAHRSSSQGLAILHMNLLHPDVDRGPEGQPWNDGLRAPSRNTKAPRLAGELWRGFAAILDDDLDYWSADTEPNGG